jgi:large subunit ribosomal protein L24
MRIKTGDMVKVIAGKSKGLIGKIASIDRTTERVILENGPTNKRHMKPEKSRKHPEGGILERPASIHASNVMLMSEPAGRPVRVGFEVRDGQKIRVGKGPNASKEAI